MDKKKDKNEDTTKYGEFVPSYFTWMTLEEQKEIADKLSKITKKWEQISLFSNFLRTFVKAIEPLSKALKYIFSMSIIKAKEIMPLERDEILNDWL